MDAYQAEKIRAGLDSDWDQWGETLLIASDDNSTGLAMLNDFLRGAGFAVKWFGDPIGRMFAASLVQLATREAMFRMAEQGRVESDVLREEL